MPQPDTRLKDLRTHLKALSDRSLMEAEHIENAELHFTQAVPKLRVLRRLGEAFAQEHEDEMPTQIVEQIRQTYATAAKMVERMIDFKVEANNAYAAHREIVGQVDQLYNTTINNLRPHIRAKSNVTALAEQLEQKISAAEEMQQKYEELNHAADVLVRQAETLAGELAAGSLSSYYDGQANKHRETSKWYLIGAAAGAALVATLAVILFVTIDDHPATEWTAYIRDLGVRVFVLGLGLYVVGFMVKGYRANQHLLVVNEHKANALKTFRLFQESASEDSPTRDLITAELVKAVFAADETGFLDNAPDRTVVDGQSGLLALLAQQSKS
jgi:hypothetical protein